MTLQTEQFTTIQTFPAADGTISIWDHPNFKSNIVLPDNYRPLTRMESGLEMLSSGKLNENQVKVLKVVADAVCANENQLRRYFASQWSASVTSQYLRYLLKFGFVERHKCRLAFSEEDSPETVRPPAPYTLGLGGFKLICHLYSENQFTSPEFWQQNSLAVQRYVAMNEIRCLAVESKSIRKWSWHPYIGGMSSYKRPFAAAHIDTGQGELQLFIERAQMAQEFLGYLLTRFEEYRYLFTRDKSVHIDGFSKEPFKQSVVISVSSVSMANHLQEQMKLHTYPFTVWLLIDEWFDIEGGMESAFAMVSPEGLKRLKLSFLRRT